MAERIKLGLIGAGRIGRVHAQNLAYAIPQAELAAIADIFSEGAQHLAVELNVAQAYSDYRHILSDPAIQAVVICSSTDTHDQIIAESAHAGKHIFCEKPIALDLARIDHALEAVRQAGVKLQIGFNRRYDPSFRRARDLIAAGQVGSPHILRITSRDPAPPPLDYIRVSGGIFLDMTIHDFDMARFLVGSEVEEVYAAGAVLVDPAIAAAGDLDTALVTLRFANGALGMIDNSRKAVYGYDQRVEVFGSAGAVIVSNKTPDLAVVSDAAGVHASKPLHFFIERYADAYLAEMREFVGCVREDSQPATTGKDGRMAAVLGYAAWQSYREHRPIKVSDEFAPIS